MSKLRLLKIVRSLCATDKGDEGLRLRMKRCFQILVGHMSEGVGVYGRVRIHSVCVCMLELVQQLVVCHGKKGYEYSCAIASPSSSWTTRMRRGEGILQGIDVHLCTCACHPSCVLTVMQERVQGCDSSYIVRGVRLFCG